MVTAVRGSNFAPFSPFLVQPNREEPSSVLSPPQPSSPPTEEEEPTRGAIASEDSGEEANPTGEEELTPEEQREVQRLRLTDRQVRQHEQAHLSAAGTYAQSGAQFQYETGPDGKRYAVGGEIAISTSPEATPEQTLRKSEIIRRAALAPVDPSAQDRRVAAQALRLEAQARAELAREAEETAESDGTPSSEANANSSPQAPFPSPPGSGEETARATIFAPESTAGLILDLIG